MAREAKGLGGYVDAQAGEEPETSDLSRGRVVGGELGQRGVDLEKGVGGGGHAIAFLEGEPPRVPLRLTARLRRACSTKMRCMTTAAASRPKPSSSRPDWPSP